MTAPSPSRRRLAPVPDRPGTRWQIDPKDHFGSWLAERRRALDRVFAAWQAEDAEQQLSLLEEEAA